MIRRALFAVLVAGSPGPAIAADPVAAAEAASAALSDAAASLSEARRAGDRVAALTDTVRAYEDGLEALREGMRQAAIRERAIRARFDEEEEQLTRLLGALISMQASPEALVLLHPDGPLANARAGMVLTDVTPAISMRVETLRSELRELSLLGALQEAARDTLQTGLDGVQDARAALSEAISERATPARLSAIDTETLQNLVNSADTLDGFAATLTAIGGPAPAGLGFSDRKGQLALPAVGVVVAGYEEADARGNARPGLLIATAPLALVTTPHPATVRYAGPLLDLGQVAILEPEAGFLLVLAGLGSIYPEVGEVLDAGAPVGLMGGASPDDEEILIETSQGGGQARPETLYIELRQGRTNLDPGPWFGL